MPDKLGPAGKAMAEVYATANVDIQLCVCMVGLPARGKTYIAEKVRRYLQWLSVPTKSFNVGNYRRKTNMPFPSAEFFNPANPEGERARQQAAQAAVDDMISWFKDETHVVGVLDATNSTKQRRKWLKQTCDAHGIAVLFVESVCDDEDLIMRNILEVKVSSPDYAGQDPEKASADFRERIKNYERAYEAIDVDGDEQSYTSVKMINGGNQVMVNHVKHYLESRIVHFLQNLHIKPRSIWLSRHGESQFNVEGKLGGDALLSDRGRQYSEMLPELVKKSTGGLQDLSVWTSTLRRTIATAKHLPFKKLEWKALDELDAGICDGLTYDDIERLHPEETKRDNDKFNYRYRGGESYRDVVIRLEPIIMELERQENVMIVCHQAVLRCIYAYYHNIPQDELPYINIPLHEVIKFTPKPYHTAEERISSGISAVSTHRPKPAKVKALEIVENLK
ncbi:6-phosphofructo-2-kinase-domain-containing protein [Protomyces lactucae-debilis]|uniref:6-phosphofructo-2-kinase-domain-containing protein n=1 Tax=Protomyces lactucae-debilis TaxID=2754530 RepID=A0A1Y2F1H1_PROLT|nr:6-phosphofructo-2-kinase-domain-containing protein [Protomyces lactucae-debilis]ORY77742.1 6-phosphofructo-2-kinase-domain-containing protein [Protomyces lactucae-debilis]